MIAVVVAGWIGRIRRTVTGSVGNHGTTGATAGSAAGRGRRCTPSPLSRTRLGKLSFKRSCALCARQPAVETAFTRSTTAQQQSYCSPAGHHTEPGRKSCVRSPEKPTTSPASGTSSTLRTSSWAALRPRRHVAARKALATFAPHVDTGDFVIVINAEKVALTGNKAEQKLDQRHSGIPRRSEVHDLR